MSDGDETWYPSLTHHVGKAYQVSSLSDTEHVRRRVRNVIFIRQVNGFLWSKYAFRMRPRTCSVSDGDETWYASLTHHVGEVYQVSSSSDTDEHVRGRVRNVVFDHRESICVPKQKLRFGRARAHVRCWIGMKLGTSL